MTQVILVDQQDEAIGSAEKMQAHQQGLLHRAFSIFVIRHQDTEPEVLLQQRALQKYHSPGLWTNTCCSHPQPGDDLLSSARQRLQEEFGFNVPLKEIGVFTYRAEFANGMIEYEVDHVLIGNADDTLSIAANANEINNYRWVSLKHALNDSKINPTLYTPWFAQATQIVIDYIL